MKVGLFIFETGNDKGKNLNILQQKAMYFFLPNSAKFSRNSGMN